MKPINVKALYGDKFKIGLDDAMDAHTPDPWYYQILCQYGHIYPISDKRLGFFCESGNIKERLKREHPEIDIPQDGDGEGVFAFMLDQFEIVAKYAKPLKKRKLSPEQKEKCVNNLRAYRFKPNPKAVKTGSAISKGTDGGD